LGITYEEWSRVLAVNLTGPFLCTQAAAPLIRDSGGGAVVNITSISGLRASTLRTAYGTSKAGLAHLTQQQAIELASLGIRVNAVAPGPVDTAMAKAVHTQDIRAAYHDAIPLNRYGLEQELAEAIFFLCSDRASYITGQTIAVDGGFEPTGFSEHRWSVELVSVLGLKQSQRCSAEDVQVKKRGPIFNVIKVELDSFLDFCFIVDLAAPTVNLRPTSDSGLDAMAREIAIDRLVEQSVLQFALDRVRARPDQR
jgi:Enoyl-(Acyl carrier protein) reductase